MQRLGKDGQRLFYLLKCLLFSYLLTGGLLLLLALLLFRFQLSEQIVSIAIIVIYIVSSFLAGFLAGKAGMSRRFLWGLVMGVAYFGIMVLVSLGINHTLKDLSTNLFTTFAMCAAGGMLGGMVS